jgi:thioredoxin
MEVLTTQTFKEKIFDFEKSEIWKFNGNKPTIVDFYADWCGPCQALAPVLDRLAITYAGIVDIYKVDTEATPELAALFGVRGIPSLLFIPKEGEPAMNSGFMEEAAFERAIKELFQIDPPKKS